jgi:hypothetical protein
LHFQPKKLYLVFLELDEAQANVVLWFQGEVEYIVSCGVVLRELHSHIPQVLCHL